jgi:hypothetical protein
MLVIHQRAYHKAADEGKDGNPTKNSANNIANVESGDTNIHVWRCKRSIR